jgi:hypothetical protein
MTLSYEFECWEINFPDDPDGEPTRGITQEQAEEMVRDGVLELESEGVVRNSYGQRVYSHTYTPLPDQDGEAWERMSA